MLEAAAVYAFVYENVYMRRCFHLKRAGPGWINEVRLTGGVHGEEGVQALVFFLCSVFPERDRGEARQGDAGGGPAGSDHRWPRRGHRQTREGTPHPSRGLAGTGKKRDGGEELQRPRAEVAANLGSRGHMHSEDERMGCGGSTRHEEADGGG